MVFAELYRQRRFQEGRQEGIKEERRAWEAWNERRMQAEANCETFDEAPPSQRHTNGNNL